MPCSAPDRQRLWGAGELERARNDCQTTTKAQPNDSALIDASLTPLFARPSYEVAAEHDLPRALNRAKLRALQSQGAKPDASADGFVGMSFWTDAAVLGSAGIPSVLFGPGGAGLHGAEEYVEVQDVLRCRDTLAVLARGWCVAE